MGEHQLEKAINEFLRGNYPNPRMFRHKGGKCGHGVWYWEPCEQCADEYFEKVLTEWRGG